MQPDPIHAFHQALRLGPGHCPPDLFDGSVPAIVRGLKAHANNIAHARHTALEETYPRLALRVGSSVFHEAVERFLEQDDVLDRSLDLLGRGFEEVLERPLDRDLARAEWTWLAAFQATEAEALTVTALAKLTPHALTRATLLLHPATRCVPLEAAEDFSWDQPLTGDGDFLLVTRPATEVRLRHTNKVVATIVAQLQTHVAPASITSEPGAFMTLVEAGAVQWEDRP